MKHIKRVIIIAVVTLFTLSSCNLIFNTDIGDDIEDLAAFAVGLDTAARFIALDADFTSGARTINHSDAVDQYIKGTPVLTYEHNGGNGSNEIQIPGSNGVITNFYGTNPAITASFSMKPEGQGYRIKLYIYDAGDFLLDYVYEEYFVRTGSWAHLESDWSTTGFIDYYDNMHDGAKIEHTNYLFGPDSSGDNVYNIAIDPITDDISAYKFTLRDDGTTPSLFDTQTEIDAPDIETPGGFYSYKESTGNYSTEAASRKGAERPNFEAQTYYAELNDQQERNLVSFSLQAVDKEKNSYARVVTRYQEMYDNSTDEMILESKELNSLTTFADKDGDTWQHVSKEIMQSINGGGLTEIDHDEKVYYEGSEVNGSPDKSTSMSLTQDEAEENDFTGNMVVTTSKKTTSYTVTYNGTKFKTSKIKSRNTRAVGEEAIELDLSLLENGQKFTLQLPGGSRFEGAFFNGRLTGILRYPNGDMKQIDIIEGVVFLNDVLWQ